MTKALNILINMRDEAKSILDIILRKGMLSKSEILDLTNMKLSTLNRVMQPLLEHKFIIESSVGESTGGRKPILYDVNHQQYHLVGVEISRAYTNMIFTNLKMDILYQRQISMSKSSTPEQIVQLISEFILQGIKKISLNKDMIIGIGIGTVGPLDRKAGIILNPHNFSAEGWSNVPIKEMLENKTKLPVTIDNGANTAVLSEYTFGIGNDYDRIAYIHCGVGIRMGTISSGILVRSIHNMEDVFGHMTIDMDGEKCNCGNYGCIECYSTIPVIVKNFVAKLKKGHTTILKKPIEEINYVDICMAAENNDALSREIIVGAGAALGVGVANYINLLNPQVVILSGPLVKHSKLFFDSCVRVALKKSILREQGKIKFSRGGFFHDNAIAVGAASLMIREVLSNKFIGE